MRKQNINTDGEKSTDAFQMIAGIMTDFRNEMEYFDSIGSSIAAKTRFIIRAVFITLIISSAYLVYMIIQMSNNMTIMTTHLEDMYSSFGTMSNDMHEITQTVDLMSRSISGIPSIADSMIQIDKDVNAMKGSVNAINLNITAIDQDLVKINLSMWEMTGRLSNMNRSVNLISHDVNEMASPINSGPMSGFWPK